MENCRVYGLLGVNGVNHNLLKCPNQAGIYSNRGSARVVFQRRPGLLLRLRCDGGVAVPSRGRVGHGVVAGCRVTISASSSLGTLRLGGGAWGEVSNWNS